MIYDRIKRRRANLVLLFSILLLSNERTLLSYNFCGADAINNHYVILNVEDVHPSLVVAHHPSCLGVVPPNVGHRAWTVKVGKH